MAAPHLDYAALQQGSRQPLCTPISTPRLSRGTGRCSACLLCTWIAGYVHGTCPSRCPVQPCCRHDHTAAGTPSTPVATARRRSLASSKRVHGDLCMLVNPHGHEHPLLRFSVTTPPSSTHEVSESHLGGYAGWAAVRPLAAYAHV